VLETSHPDGLTAALEASIGGEQITVTVRIEGAAVVSQSFTAADGERTCTKVLMPGS
jgi:hypothetical protein